MSPKIRSRMDKKFQQIQSNFYWIPDLCTPNQKTIITLITKTLKKMLEKFIPHKGNALYWNAMHIPLAEKFNQHNWLVHKLICRRQRKIYLRRFVEPYLVVCVEPEQVQLHPQPYNRVRRDIIRTKKKINKLHGIQKYMTVKDITISNS